MLKTRFLIYVCIVNRFGTAAAANKRRQTISTVGRHSKPLHSHTPTHLAIATILSEIGKGTRNSFRSEQGKLLTLFARQYQPTSNRASGKGREGTRELGWGVHLFLIPSCVCTEARTSNVTPSKVGKIVEGGGAERGGRRAIREQGGHVVYRAAGCGLVVGSCAKKKKSLARLMSS